MHPDTPAWVESARLWLVLDRESAAPRSLPEVAKLCLQGGVDAVLFRMRDAAESEVMAVGEKVLEVCRSFGKPMIMSHFPYQAIDLGADGIQLGAVDLPIERVRSFCGNTVIGFSAHSIDEARQVVKQGAQYVFLGPVFATPSKLAHGKPLGTQIVLAATEIGIPAILVGGINLDTLPQIIAAGGARIAAIRALQAAPDPAAAAASLKQMLLQSLCDSSN